jgi:hypothetical protein
METGKTIAAAKFKSLAAEYRQRTGLHLVLVDLEGRIIYGAGGCDFCRKAAAGREENLAKFGVAAGALGLKAKGVKSISLKKAKEAVSQLMSLTQKHQINDLAFLKERNEKYIRQYKIANFLEKLKRENPDIARKILDKQDEIIQKVKLGDRAGAREILNEFLGSIFFESGMNFEVIKVRIIELIVIISRAAIEAGVGAQELLGLNYSYLTELSKVTDLEELLFKVTRVLENFIAKVSLGQGEKTEGPGPEDARFHPPELHPEDHRPGRGRRGRTQRWPGPAPLSRGDGDGPDGIHQ